VPPLRERADDIPLLADHFWRAFIGDDGGGIPASLLPELTVNRWPGNVRELRHRVEQLALLRPREEREEERQEKGPQPAPRASYREAKATALDAFEAGFLAELMARANGNVSEAARLASMDRVHLSKLLRKHGLRGH
jgi:DNA-binding NtrC family response regulator